MYTRLDIEQAFEMVPERIYPAVTMRFLWISGVLSLLCSLMGAWLTNLFLQSRRAIVGDFIGLERSFNDGIAFGIQIPSPWQSILILTALVLMGFFALRHANTRLSQGAFGLILGGGIANVIDRLMDGFVTDMIQIGSFPVFNVADSCITIGVVLLAVDMLLHKEPPKTV